MRTLASLWLVSAFCLTAQVRFSPKDKSITIDGKAFTTFHEGVEAAKPYLAPLRSASGKIVTRRFPMENVPGESRDHLHHRGLWFSYDDVNGVKFWENEPTYTKGNMGRIVVRKTDWKDGDKSGTLTAMMDWRDSKGETLLTEQRTMTFYSHPTLRMIDIEIALTAARDVTFGDTKEGAFAIRLAEPFTEKKGGKIVDADGRTGMAKVWGKRSNWVDYSGDIDGEKLGVAIFDDPRNPRHPTYWHARDYGLFSANPFGQNAFDPNAPESHLKLATGQKIVLRWRVVIHPGDADVAQLYKDYAAKD
jgi:hypothetical protein